MTERVENDEPLITLDGFAKKKGFAVAWLQEQGVVDPKGVAGADTWKVVEPEDLADCTRIRLHKDGDVAKKPGEKSGGETFVASDVRRLRYLNFEGELAVVDYLLEDGCSKNG